MKKISIILGIGIIGLTLLSFTGKGGCEKSKEVHEDATALTELQKPFIKKLLAQYVNETLSIDDINLIEMEEEIHLGFDTAEYLPIEFNAYKGMGLDLSEIDLVEIEEEIDLGFNTAEYLPAGFNPYKGMDCVNQIASEEQIGFHLETDSK
jgi:hypothetical protein